MSTDLVTVLVPTINRPMMLRKSLESIANQSAVARIQRIIVSENAHSSTSRAVAHEFSDRLPIEYLFREPPLSPLAHAIALNKALPSTGIMAVLHDDDWWQPDHLANSINRLERNPDASASYSGFFNVEGESSCLGCDSNIMFWFGAGYPRLTDMWLLPAGDVMLGSLWGTPGRFSTLVARSSAYTAASCVFQMGNPFDVDRLLTLQLSLSGPIVVGPLPEVFIRSHPNQDGNRYDSRQRKVFLSSTTEHIILLAESRQTDLRKGLEARLRTCPPSARNVILASLIAPWCAGPLTEHRLAPNELLTHVKRWTPNTRYHLGRWLPPILLDALGRRQP